MLSATIISRKELNMGGINKITAGTSSFSNATCELLSGAKNAPDFANPIIFGITIFAGVIVAGMTLGYGFKGGFDLARMKGSIAFKR